MNKSSNLIFHQFEIGPMANFQYFLGDKATGEIAVVDPAWDVNFLRSEAAQNNYKIVSIFLTHAHPDHTNGIPELLKTHDVPVYVSKDEIPILLPKTQKLIKVNNHDKLKIGNIEFECIFTPGHSPGCMLIKNGDVVISGDTLFVDGCGRCDIPGSNPKQMYHSLYEIVMKLPDSNIIYPGHNYGDTPSATIASQKKTNPYLQSASMQEFLTERMGVGF